MTRTLLHTALTLVALLLFAAHTEAQGRRTERAERSDRAAASFRDCPACPIMVAIPPGQFMMGSPDTERSRGADEGPRHQVEIKQALAVGKFEVTFAEWDACVAQGGCNHTPGDERWGRGKRGNKRCSIARKAAWLPSSAPVSNEVG